MISGLDLWLRDLRFWILWQRAWGCMILWFGVWGFGFEGVSGPGLCLLYISLKNLVSCG